MIELSIPQVPWSTNKKESKSWTPYGQVQLADMKTLWVDEIWAALVKKRALWKTGCFYIKAKITIKIFFRTDAHRDADNYTCKEVIDAIRHNRIIEDDDYDHIGKVNVDITGRDKHHPRTEITIQETKQCQ